MVLQLHQLFKNQLPLQLMIILGIRNNHNNKCAPNKRIPHSHKLPYDAQIMDWINVEEASLQLQFKS